MFFIDSFPIHRPSVSCIPLLKCTIILPRILWQNIKSPTAWLQSYKGFHPELICVLCETDYALVSTWLLGLVWKILELGLMGQVGWSRECTAVPKAGGRPAGCASSAALRSMFCTRRCFVTNFPPRWRICSSASSRFYVLPNKAWVTPAGELLTGPVVAVWGASLPVTSGPLSVPSVSYLPSCLRRSWHNSYVRETHKTP